MSVSGRFLLVYSSAWAAAELALWVCRGDSYTACMFALNVLIAFVVAVVIPSRGAA